jgi:DNA-binding PadR family transcriptional regulator
MGVADTGVGGRADFVVEPAVGGQTSVKGSSYGQPSYCAAPGAVGSVCQGHASIRVVRKPPGRNRRGGLFIEVILLCIVPDMSIGHVLLGVLDGSPAHGYDLKHAYDVLFPGARPLGFGQVYASLARLQRDGLVEVAERSQGGGPERTLYALTPEGRRRLHEWLDETVPPGPYAADDLVRKTVTALDVGEDAGRFLRAQRTAHLARMRELLAAQDRAETRAAQIALDHAIFHLDADLRWLDAAEARIAADHRGVSSTEGGR